MKINKRVSLILSVLFIFISGCGLKVGNLDVGKIATTGSRMLSGNKLTIEQRQSIGQQMAAIVVGASELHKDDNLQRYVNRVGRWVASHASVDGAVQWQFIVIDTPDFNAFSMPGGYIIISSGVIDRLSSEAELAAVLAHEIVHVEQKHQVKAIEKGSMLSDLGELGFILADYNQANKGGYNANSIQNRQIAKELFGVTHNLYTKGLGRDDELDADQKAVVLMTRAGYDPYAYLSMMQLVESVDDDNKTLMLATHPKVSDRLHVAYSTLNSLDKYLPATKAVEKRFINNVP